MANVIKHKRGSGSDPGASDLILGELAIRTDTGKLFTKMDSGAIAEIAGGGSDIAINTLSSSSGTGGGSATFNGSAYRFTLSQPPNVSAAQLLVSINGVIQKPVAGTGQPSEGFSVDGTDIILGDAPATGSDFFILTFKSLGVSEPADNSVTSAKIVDGAIVNADINASAAIAGTKISPDFGSQNIITTGNINIGAGTGRLDSNGIIKTAHGTESAPSHTFINDTDNGMFRVTTNTIGFATGGSERMRIDSAGRVGIGCTPTAQFDHNLIQIGNQATLGANASLSTTGQTFLTHNLYFDPSGNYQVFNTSNANEGTILRMFDGNFTFSNSPQTTGTPTVTERMRIDSSGNVGLNTTSMAGKLNVQGSAGGVALQTTDATNSTFRISHPSAAVTLLSGGSSQHLALGTGFAEKMRIDSSGNVGIGTTSPGSPLTIDTGGTADALRIGNSAGTDTFIRLGSTGTNTDTHGVIKYDKDDNYLSLVVAGESHGGGGILIANGGNVGIGTSSPSSKLHIAENASGTTDMLILHANADGAGENNGIASIKLMGDAEHAAFIKGGHTSNGNTILTFHTDAHDSGKNPQERMRILDDGAVVINATARPVVGTEFLGVHGGSASNSVGIAAAVSHNEGIPFFASNSSNSFADRLMRFAAGSGGDVRGTIIFNGSAMVYGGTSDYRLKENITSISDGITKLKNLNPINFNWIKDETNTNIMGFLAHEVQAVMPEAVAGEKDAVDSKGKEDYQEMDYGRITPLIVAALQEAIGRIEALEAK
jgi:hypothetical protein